LEPKGGKGHALQLFSYSCAEEFEEEQQEEDIRDMLIWDQRRRGFAYLCAEELKKRDHAQGSFYDKFAALRA
jgi:hypothetical protein